MSEWQSMGWMLRYQHALIVFVIVASPLVRHLQRLFCNWFFHLQVIRGVACETTAKNAQDDVGAKSSH